MRRGRSEAKKKKRKHIQRKENESKRLYHQAGHSFIRKCSCFLDLMDHPLRGYTKDMCEEENE